MDTNEIRALIPWNDPCAQCATHTIGHRLDAVIGAIRTVADALDELDERTRPGGALGEQMRDEESEWEWEKLQAEGTPGPASTIPGCYCRECKHAQFVDEGKYWTCALRGSPAYAVVSVPVDFGCTLGERREAE